MDNGTTLLLPHRTGWQPLCYESRRRSNATSWSRKSLVRRKHWGWQLLMVVIRVVAPVQCRSLPPASKTEFGSLLCGIIGWMWNALHGLTCVNISPAAALLWKVWVVSLEGGAWLEEVGYCRWAFQFRFLFCLWLPTQLTSCYDCHSQEPLIFPSW